MAKRRSFVACSLAVAMAVAWVAPAASQRRGPSSATAGGDPRAKFQARAGRASLAPPISFEQNLGQTDGQVKFLSRGAGRALFLTPTEAVLTLQPPGHKGVKARPPKPAQPSDVVRMKMIGANMAPRIDGADRLAGQSNYYMGSDASRWQTGVPSYSKVVYRGVYPGIDLVYHGASGQLEYDFVVNPGADPSKIEVALNGATLSVTPRGDLVVSTRGGQLRQPKPVLYQTISGKKKRIAGGYVLKGKDRFRFEVAPYVKSKPLVIDPVMVSYFTYLGGTGDENGEAIALDPSGNVYVTGRTSSIDFPCEPAPECRRGHIPRSNELEGDAFLTKLNTHAPGGGRSSLIFSTYFGGAGDDSGLAVAANAEGALVAGVTGNNGGDCPDFPTDTALLSPGGGFVTKFTSTGALAYSTCAPRASGVALDSAGRVYITGDIQGSPFTPVNAAQSTPGGLLDTFVAKLSAGPAPTVMYASYLGGGGRDSASAIAVDRAGNVYLTGWTESIDFPTRFPFQPVKMAGADAFVAKIDPSSSGLVSLVYSTYLGGSDRRLPTERSNCPPPGGASFPCQAGNAIAVDALGRVYVAGYTQSDKFPVTPKAYQATINRTSEDSSDAFLVKLDPSRPGPLSMIYSTYFGGNGDDQARSISVEPVDPPTGNVYISGETFKPGDSNRPGASHVFPTTKEGSTTTEAFQGSLHGGTDGFVAKFSLPDSPTVEGKLLYSTLLGGAQGKSQAGWLKLNTPLGGRQGRSTVWKMDDYYTGTDVANGIAVDASGSAYIVGTTGSWDWDPAIYPVNGYQPKKGNLPSQDSVPPGTNQPDPAGGDAFVAVIGPTPPLPPTITGLNNNTASACGGDVINIDGSGFSGAGIAVKFGDKAAQKIVVNATGTQIAATTPPGNPGPASVTVTTPQGVASFAGFAYLPAICGGLGIGLGPINLGNNPAPPKSGDGAAPGPPKSGDGSSPGQGAAGPKSGAGVNPPALPGTGGPAPVSVSVPSSGPAPGHFSAPSALSAPTPGSAPSAGTVPIPGLGGAAASAQSAGGATASVPQAAAGSALAESQEKAGQPAPRFLMTRIPSGSASAAFLFTGILLLSCCTIVIRRRPLIGTHPGSAVEPAIQAAY